MFPFKFMVLLAAIGVMLRIHIRANRRERIRAFCSRPFRDDVSQQG